MSDDPEPPARLRAVHPTDLRWSQVLPRSTVVLGRIEAKTVQLALAHGTVSRRHFEVRWNEAQGRHEGRDLGSHNGSRVDGRDIGQSLAPLEDGTVLQLGDVCLVYEQIPPGRIETASAMGEPIPGAAPRIVALREAMVQAADDAAPVLLWGEHGTGKEHVARELHRLSGRRGPLVTFDCSTLSTEVIDGQLFGQVEGSGSDGAHAQAGLFRAAEGGTLVLEEIGDLPPPLQPKLLHVLHEGRIQPMGTTQTLPVDVRVIATTDANLERRIDKGGFRRDLFARLAVWQLRVPALRERRGDLLIWLERLHAYWLDRRPEHPVDTLTLSAEAAEAVLLYDWPENLQELDRLVHELASAPHMPRPIPRSRLPNWVRISDPMTSDARTTAEVGPPATLEQLRPPAPSREEFIEAFERFDGDIRAIARHFARDRRQIYRWIQRHGLSDHDEG